MTEQLKAGDDVSFRSPTMRSTIIEGKFEKKIDDNKFIINTKLAGFADKKWVVPLKDLQLTDIFNKAQKVEPEVKDVDAPKVPTKEELEVLETGYKDLAGKHNLKYKGVQKDIDKSIAFVLFNDTIGAAEHATYAILPENVTEEGVATHVASKRADFKVTPEEIAGTEPQIPVDKEEVDRLKAPVPPVPPQDVIPFQGPEGEGKDFVDQYEKQKDIWFGHKDTRVLQSKIEKRRLQKDILRALNKTKYDTEAKNYDEAIQIHIDSKRNPDNIVEYYDKLTPEQKNIVDLSQDLPPEIQAIADNITSIYGQVGTEALEVEVIRNVLDNYVSRVWDIEGKQGMEKFRKFGITSRHAKARTFDTIIEGWGNGYKLKVAGATSNLQILKEEMVKTISDKKFLKTLQKLKTLDGDPLLTTKQLEDYQIVEHPNFKVWKYAGKAPEAEASGRLYGRNFFRTEEGDLYERRDLYAPKKLAKNLNNILGISKLKGIPPIDFITKWNAVIKSWILQSSFFHHLAFTRSYYFGTNNKKWGDMSLRQAYKNGIRMIEEEDPIVMLGVKNGLTLGLKQDWNEELIRETSALDKKLDTMKVIGPVKKKIMDLRIQHVDFLFGEFGAGLKAKSFVIEYQNLLRKHPDKNSDDLAKMAANLINDDFGGLHLQRMGRNPTLQHIFRIFALAPDWTESNIRTMIKAFKSGTKEETKMYRKFWSGILTKAVGLSLLGNWLMASMDEDDKKTKGTFDRFIRNYKRAWKEGKLRWTGIDITPIYKMLGGTSDQRKYFSVPGHFTDPLKFITHPIRSAHHKGSIVYKFFHELFAGVDWAGRRFTTFEEIIGQDKEKGFYKTTRKGKYKKGDPKYGKLKFKTVVWDFKGRGSIGYKQLPSFGIAQAKGWLPVQIQNLLAWGAGEMEGFDAILKSAGLRIGTTYGEPKEKEKTKYGNRLLEKYGLNKTKGSNLLDKYR